MANDLTPEQNEKVEQAFQEAFRRYLAEAGSGTNVPRYFFFAGAQLGVGLIKEIWNQHYKRLQETEL